MMEIEIKIISDRREGLLIGLAQVVIASGFTLQRQRMINIDDGAQLNMVIRGDEPNLPQLQQRLAAHELVRSFEIIGVSAGASPAATASPSPTGGPASASEAAIDQRKVEDLLPQLARSYPDILPRLVALDRELPQEQREATMRHIGQRVGAWVYKRDYALGGQLAPAEAVRRIAQPALRPLLQIEAQGDLLRVQNSPFCRKGDPGARCHFISGMLAGLIGGKNGADSVSIVEMQCRSAGADACVFKHT